MEPVIITAVHIQPDPEWYVPPGSIIVDDSEGKVNLPVPLYGLEEQEKELGQHHEPFNLFRKSSASKNFGLLKAYRDGKDAVMIDSDCIIPDNFIKEYKKQMNKRNYGWVNPLPGGRWFPRGFPYEERSKRPVLHMGMWNGASDINGLDRINTNGKLPHLNQKTRGTALGNMPLSGMNVYIKNEAIPGYILLPNADYNGIKFRRHDDIWGGYIFQQLARKRRDVISYGPPFVDHKSAINPYEDAEAEEGMIKYHQTFEDWVDEGMRYVYRGSYHRMMCQLGEALPDEEMFQTFKDAINFWNTLMQP